MNSNHYISFSGKVPHPTLCR